MNKRVTKKGSSKTHRPVVVKIPPGVSFCDDVKWYSGTNKPRSKMTTAGYSEFQRQNQRAAMEARQRREQAANG